MSISERLKQIVDYKGTSSRSFALKIGTSSQVFGKYLEGRAPSYEVLAAIIEANNDINPDWLLTGRGEMLLGEQQKNNSDYSDLIATNRNLSEIIKNLTSK